MPAHRVAPREWMERRQLALYPAAIVAGLSVGLALPGADLLGAGIDPAIALLLYVTFLGVPFARIGAAFRDVRFLLTLLALNFVVVPVVVFALSRLVAHDAALLVGLLLVLLTPCIDYVIVFSALAGAAHEKLLAAAPLLMIAQLVLLPGYLSLFAGPSALGIIEPGPFAEAFLVLIAIPLLAAAITQRAAPRDRAFRAVARAGAASMVPLMMLVLFVVVASQARRIAADAASLVALVPIYAGFLVVMAGIGIVTARLARLDAPSARALTFSGATRNSLVVLPLALALPPALALAPAAVVTQTLVELVGMVVYVRLVPRLVPDPTS
ncbi:bile acid:sodium symporter [Microbacterium betulae]|uniref:Bile acid:sodium symporter n=1 Tax=Microbacterium betulae TaxID=2981139 RepID=A0AA97I4U0_9MICO|nr:bile acid:sodium symporter [Microbacterium sp. AB]WOF22951.1 bile acid:sodium symporter [Microbacterium sp. AB]